MPRKSINELSVVRPDSGTAPGLLLPGSHVPATVRVVFAEIVGSVSVGHFSTADRALLEQFATALHVAREIAAAVDAEGVVVEGRLNPLAKALKQQQAIVGQLASRLRLTTQSRISKDKASRTARGGSQSISELYDRGVRHGADS